MQNVRFIGAMVSQFCSFKKKKKMKKNSKKKNMDNLVFHTSCDIFIQFFAGSYFYYMFSTLMSLEDRLN